MKAEPETPDLKWITLDCSLMEPPEPMLRVLEQLDRLKQGEGIKMLHRMKPRLLFPKLQEISDVDPCVIDIEKLNFFQK